MAEKLLTLKGVCEHLGGVSEVTLWRWRKNPTLGFPPPVQVNRRTFWRPADIDRWCESRIAPAA